nr:hypothetical protein [Tanacetum cinerariifolium]
VNALASALTRLGELAGAVELTAQARKSAHRRLLETLAGNPGAEAYGDLLDRTLTVEGNFSADEWTQAQPLILKIVSQLTGA